MWTNQHDTMLIFLYQFDLYWYADFDDIIVEKCTKYRVTGMQHVKRVIRLNTNWRGWLWATWLTWAKNHVSSFYFRGSCFSIYFYTLMLTVLRSVSWPLNGKGVLLLTFSSNFHFIINLCNLAIMIFMLFMLIWWQQTLEEYT